MQLDKFLVMFLYIFSFSFLECAQKMDNPPKRNYSLDQLQKIDEIDNALIALAAFIDAVESGYYWGQTACKRREYRKNWAHIKELTKCAVLYQGIHTDDIERNSHRQKGDSLFALCIAFSDDAFAEFLLMHGASANNYDFLRVSHAPLTFATKLIEFGADVVPPEGDSGGGLHNLSISNSHSPDLALLYYMHGADPKAVDKCCATPLIQLAAHTIEASRKLCPSPEIFKICLKLASNLIKIGVPLDAQMSRDCVISHVQLKPGDTILSILEESLPDQEHLIWHPELPERIKIFKQTISDAQAEVDEAYKKHAHELAQVLQQHIPAYGVRSLIAHYAQDYVLPLSIHEDLKRIREQERRVLRKFDKQDQEASSGSCAIS